MSEAWEEFQDRLVSELAALPVGASLVVAEPDSEPAPAPDLKWWQVFGARSHVVAGRYVQFQRWNEVVRAECVSAAYRPVSGGQHRALLDLGWSDPATHPARWSTDNYVYDGAPAEFGRLADLCVRSLQVLGAGPDAAWTWQVIE